MNGIDMRFFFWTPGSKQCTNLWGESFKTTIDLHCLIPPIGFLAIDLLSPDSFNSHIPSCCILPVLKQRDKQQILIQHRKNMKTGTFPKKLYKSTINNQHHRKPRCSPTEKNMFCLGSPWRHDVFEECCFQKLRSYDHGHRHHGHWNLGPIGPPRRLRESQHHKSNPQKSEKMWSLGAWRPRWFF